MTGWFEVLEIFFFLAVWLVAVFVLVPHDRGGFT